MDGGVPWDLVVIGGGPAGMMAAGRAAELGRRVLLLEKNSGLGKKLLITGGGRCNVTNHKTDVHVMLDQYGDSGKFLFSAFAQFAVADTLDFFHRRGMPTKEEEQGRVFPVSDSARSVWNVMVAGLEEHGVCVATGREVTGVTVDPQGVFAVKVKKGEDLTARAVVLATGGKSHPETGSTGEGFQWLAKLGHTVVENDFALVPLALFDPWVQRVAGLSLPDVKLTVFQDGEKRLSQKGKVLFTHVGISGPTVLNMSRAVGDLLPYSEVVIELDLYPTVDHKTLREQLNDVLAADSNKKLKNVLPGLFPKSLVPVLLELGPVDGETPCHSVRREDRVRLVALVKALPLHVKGLLGADKAVVSSGGVDLGEVDFKTMQSRVVPGLFLVGDVLNIDRPSGGYSLQLCWTTGFVAGTHAGAV